MNQSKTQSLILILILNLAFVPALASQETIHIRDLVRGMVIECTSEEPAPVEVTPEGQPSVEVEGLELADGVVCRTLDSYYNATAAGTLTEYRNGYSLSGITYKAIIQGLGTKYKISDYAEMSPASASGARYIATSNVFVNEDSETLRYFIEYIRRQQGAVVDQPASIFMVQKQVEGSVLIFVLDYRDPRI